MTSHENPGAPGFFYYEKNRQEFAHIQENTYLYLRTKGGERMRDFFDLHKAKLLFFLPAAALAACLFLFQQQASLPEDSVKPPLPEVTEPAEPEEPLLPEALFIDLKGQVTRPGVYEMKPGDRIVDLLAAAGGMTGDADDTHVNLAQLLTDEMIVYIPRDGEEIPVPQAKSAESAESGAKINLNTADLNELQTLPGIGPAKAQAIITHRETAGLFTKPEEITNVSGIGEKTFENLKEFIEVK